MGSLFASVEQKIRGLKVGYWPFSAVRHFKTEDSFRPLAEVQRLAVWRAKRFRTSHLLGIYFALPGSSRCHCFWLSGNSTGIEN